jgi:hypothetical protein
VEDLRNIRTLSEFLRGAVETLAPTLGPEEDWLPTVFLIKDDGIPVIIHTDGWANDEQRMSFVREIVQRLMETKAVAFGMIATVWTYDSKKDIPLPPYIVRPRDSPDRMEAVQVLTCSANLTIVALTPIERHPISHPTLREWEVVDGLAEGDMVTPFQQALRRVRDA